MQHLKIQKYNNYVGLRLRYEVTVEFFATTCCAKHLHSQVFVFICGGYSVFFQVETKCLLFSQISSSQVFFVHITASLDISRLENLPMWSLKNTHETQLEGELKECSGRVFINSNPEFIAPQAGIVDISEIDVILISNYMCMLALPYVTENTGFDGVIYATEPTLNLGRQFMEELVTYVERSPKSVDASKWKMTNILKLLPPPLCDAIKPWIWKKCYSMKDVNSSLSSVKMVGFSESQNVFGSLSVTAYSSGYCLGSSNWVLQSNYEKIVYLSGSSTLTTHPKPMEQSPLKNADILVLTGLTQVPLDNPDNQLAEFCIACVAVVRNGGNVLVPCYPSGVTYDLFECLTSHFDSSGISHIPVFFISPVADHSLAYSNILAEWLSQGKQNKVYLPEEPFPHGQLIKNGRLKHYASLHSGTFSSDFRSPCVVFAGHPSLRFGDAVHFIELWGHNPNNLVIFTEPDFAYLDALAPFQPLSMKTAFTPIDTSLSYMQATKLIKDLNPSHLLIPEEYTKPPILYKQKSDLTIEYDPAPIPYKCGDVLNLPIKRKFEKMSIDPDLAGSVVPSEIKPGIAVATLTGALHAQDNRFVLKSIPESPASPPSADEPKAPVEQPKKFPSAYHWGSLDVNEFMSKLEKDGITDAKLEEQPNGCIIYLQNRDALIQIEENSTHIICNSDNALRLKIRDLLLQCLNKF
ncbi:Integrator complex subunit 9 [Nymphon striatum]|nr:Integrator complex subunit 9 [Nymphon striatum]